MIRLPLGYVLLVILGKWGSLVHASSQLSIPFDLKANENEKWD